MLRVHGEGDVIQPGLNLFWLGGYLRFRDRWLYLAFNLFPPRLSYRYARRGPNGDVM